MSLFLLTKIRAAGIQQIAVSREWVQSAQLYHRGPFSLQDALCFYYAKNFNRLLLTNEKPLRNLCYQEQVSVHGTLWIIQQIDQRRILISAELCKWLSILVQKGIRMPKPELIELASTANWPLGTNHPSPHY